MSASPRPPVEARGRLVGDRLVVDEAVVARRADRLLRTGARRLRRSPRSRARSAASSAARSAKFSGQLRAQICSCRWCSGERPQVLGAPLRAGAASCAAACARPAKKWYSAASGNDRAVHSKVSRLRRGLEGGAVVERKEAPLQLADPVPAGAERQARVVLQAPLELALVEVVAVERREATGQSPEHLDQPELRGEDVRDQAELRPAREREPVLGGALAPRGADRRPPAAA